MCIRDRGRARPRRHDAAGHVRRPARGRSREVRAVAHVRPTAPRDRPRAWRIAVGESDKKGGLDDFDWDAALAEWDKKPFEPEVASEKKEAPPKPDEKPPLYRAPLK